VTERHEAPPEELAPQDTAVAVPIVATPLR
jgi:hypothetical protein